VDFPSCSVAVPISTAALIESLLILTVLTRGRPSRALPADCGDVPRRYADSLHRRFPETRERKFATVDRAMREAADSSPGKTLGVIDIKRQYRPDYSISNIRYSRSREPQAMTCAPFHDR
jgi:hypothetical protein